jgi:transposase
VPRIGLEIAKNGLQVHGVDAQGKGRIRKQLSRSQGLPFFAHLSACRIGREACGSVPYWGRELQKLGHDVRLRAVHLLKSSRTNQKKDRHEAAARGEAVSCPQLRVVPSKTVAPQAVVTVSRARGCWSLTGRQGQGRVAACEGRRGK